MTTWISMVVTHPDGTTSTYPSLSPEQALQVAEAYNVDEPGE